MHLPFTPTNLACQARLFVMPAAMLHGGKQESSLHLPMTLRVSPGSLHMF